MANIHQEDDQLPRQRQFQIINLKAATDACLWAAVLFIIKLIVDRRHHWFDVTMLPVCLVLLVVWNEGRYTDRWSTWRNILVKSFVRASPIVVAILFCCWLWLCIDKVHDGRNTPLVQTNLQQQSKFVAANRTALINQIFKINHFQASFRDHVEGRNPPADPVGREIILYVKAMCTVDAIENFLFDSYPAAVAAVLRVATEKEKWYAHLCMELLDPKRPD